MKTTPVALLETSTHSFCPYSPRKIFILELHHSPISTLCQLLLVGKGYVRPTTTVTAARSGIPPCTCKRPCSWFSRTAGLSRTDSRQCGCCISVWYTVCLCMCTVTLLNITLTWASTVNLYLLCMWKFVMMPVCPWTTALSGMLPRRLPRGHDFWFLILKHLFIGVGHSSNTVELIWLTWPCKSVWLNVSPNE